MKQLTLDEKEWSLVCYFVETAIEDLSYRIKECFQDYGEEDLEEMERKIAAGEKLLKRRPQAPPKSFKCDICGGRHPISDKHVAMQIDGEAIDQPMGLVAVCGHCYENEVDAPGWGYSNDYNDPDDYELTGKEYPKWRLKGTRNEEE